MIKYFAILCAAALSIGTANAQTTTSSTQTAAEGNAYAVAEGSTGYKNSSVSTVPALATIINSPTASCQQTYSGTASVTGFGIGLGGSKIDVDCRDLEIIRATYNMQQQGTAILELCQFAQDRFTRAVELNPCPKAFTVPSDPAIVQNEWKTAPVADTVSVGHTMASYQIAPSAPVCRMTYIAPKNPNGSGDLRLLNVATGKPCD